MGFTLFVSPWPKPSDGHKYIKMLACLSIQYIFIYIYIYSIYCTGASYSRTYIYCTGIPYYRPYTYCTGIPYYRPYTYCTRVPCCEPYTYCTGAPYSRPYTYFTGVTYYGPFTCCTEYIKGCHNTGPVPIVQEPHTPVSIHIVHGPFWL